MKKKEEPKKDFRTMTADEVIAHVFHPEVAKHLRRHVDKLSEDKQKPKK